MTHLLRDSVRTLTTRTAARALGAVSGIVVTRWLGPHDKGLYVYAAAVAAIVLQYTYGASAAIARQWGREKLDAGRVYAAGLLTGGGSVAVAVAVLAGVAAAAPGQQVLLMACAVLPFAVFVQISSAFFLAAGRVGPVNVQMVLGQTAVSIAAAVALPILHCGLNGMLVIWVCGQVAAAGYSALALREIVPVLRPAFDREIVARHVVFAVRAGLLQLATYANTRIDVLIVMFALGPSALGIYSVAVAVAELLWMISKSVAIAAYGEITTSDPERAARLTGRCVRHLVVLSAACAGAAAVLLPSAISIVYGPAFAQAAFAFAVLAPGAALWSAMDIFTVYFTSQRGRPSLITAVQVTCACVCAAITAVSAQRLGVIAGALGTSVAYAIGFVVTAIAFIRSSGSARLLLQLAPDDLGIYTRLLKWSRSW